MAQPHCSLIAQDALCSPPMRCSSFGHSSPPIPTFPLSIYRQKSCLSQCNSSSNSVKVFSAQMSPYCGTCCPYCFDPFHFVSIMDGCPSMVQVPKSWPPSPVFPLPAARFNWITEPSLSLSLTLSLLPSFPPQLNCAQQTKE
jgi:hypothetical protein